MGSEEIVMKDRILICGCLIALIPLLYFAWRTTMRAKKAEEYRRRVFSVYNVRMAFQNYLEYSNGASYLRPTANPTNYLLQIAKRFEDEDGYLFQFGRCNGEECVMDLWGNPFVVIWTKDLDELSRKGIMISDGVLRGFKIGECYMWSCGRNGKNDWGHYDDVP